MKTIQLLPIAVTLLAPAPLGGCSTALHGGDVVSGQPVNGIPYRVRDRITMEVYQLGDNGYEKAGSGVDNLADPSRLYFLNFEGQALANSNAKFEQRPDGTLTTVHIAGKAQGVATANAAADAISSYATTRQADAKAKADKASAAAAAAEAERQKADTLIDLTYKARVAEAQLAELDPTAKASDRLEAERIATEAKRAANAAALKAGQPSPFPGV